MLTVVRVLESWDVLQLQKDQRLGLSALVRDESLPLGFERLRVLNRLCTATLEHLSLVLSWLKRVPRSPHSITELSHEVLSVANLSVTERLIALTFQAYLNYLERIDQAWSNAATEHSVQMLVPALSQKTCIADCDEDVLAWSCLMLVAVTEPGSAACQWADQMLAQLRISATKQDQLGQRFVRIPSRRLQLRSDAQVAAAKAMESLTKTYSN